MWLLPSSTTMPERSCWLTQESCAGCGPGETHDYVLNLDGVNGKKFFLQVTDYAMNTVTYQIELQIGEERRCLK